jgi:hypothetical protein
MAKQKNRERRTTNDTTNRTKNRKPFEQNKMATAAVRAKFRFQ